MPFLRTFAPFVAGVAEMTRTKFTAYNVMGATDLGAGHRDGRLLPGQLALGQGQPGQDHLGHDFGAGVDRDVGCVASTHQITLVKFDACGLHQLDPELVVRGSTAACAFSGEVRSWPIE
jgi:hypothetical protein